MEKRKIIGFGKSSYVVSLPKGWMENSGLKKGDEIFIETDGNRLLLAAKNGENIKEDNKIAIECSNKPLSVIIRTIAASYIAGYKTIELNGNNMATYFSPIKKFLQDLMVFELVKESSTQIVAKDFMDVREASLNELIRRLDVIVRSMINDSKEFTIGRSNFSVDSREVDVDRLHFLNLRIIKMCFKDDALRRHFAIDYSELLNIWLLSLHLEKIADQSKRIIDYCRNIKLNNKYKKELYSLYCGVEKQYLDAINSYYKKDSNLAHEVAERHRSILKGCDNFLRKNENATIAMIMDSLRGLTTRARNIARLVITDKQFSTIK